MIVDCHVNIWADAHVQPLYGQQLGRVREKKIPEKADADTLVRVLRNVDKAIIFSLEYKETLGIAGENSVTAEAVGRFPEKFVGFAYVDPRRPDCVERLDHDVRKLGLKGVKYGPIYNGVPVGDPRLQPIFAYCEKNDIPITMHMGTTFTRLYGADLGRPIYVEKIALDYPDLKIVMAHMGHPWYEECIAIVRKQPNVYAEISALYYRKWQFFNVMKAIEEYQVGDKIFFGSDYPFSLPDEAIALTREVLHIGKDGAIPAVSSDLVEQIIHSNPFEHWWHSPLELPSGSPERTT
ncbi:MAG: amidohydrolase family protein [Parvibaculaceae bacterium]